MRQELKIVRQLDHPHIVKVIDVLEDEENIYIAQELMRHGNLQEVLQKMADSGRKLTESEIAKIVYQVLMAINYIHASSIFHRDLKLENIMVDIKHEAGPDGTREHSICCKLADFGFATWIAREPKVHILGAPLYMAPEAHARQYDNKCDIWSLGVIAYVLLTGNFPFNGATVDELLTQKKYFSPDYECLEHYRKEGKYVINFMKRCFQQRPTARPPAAALLRDKWFTKLLADVEIPEQQLVNVGVNIYTFQRVSEFQSCVIAFLAGTQSNKEEERSLSEIFTQLDQTKDGYLTKEEIMEGFEKVSQGLVSRFGRDLDWAAIVEHMDINNDGKVDYDEFVTAATNRVQLLTEENLRAAFRALDEQGDGIITANELSTVFKSSDLRGGLSNHGIQFSEQYWLDLMEEIDTNKDGQLSFEEFKAYMLPLIQGEGTQ